MEHDAIALVARAEPQRIGGDGAYFGDLQHRCQSIAETDQRAHCFGPVGCGNEQFRLQLVAAARCESHAEVRQPFVPRPGDAHLLGARFSRELGNRMHVASSRSTAQPNGDRLRIAVVGLCQHPLLAPHLFEVMRLPGREQADAVPVGHDLAEVLDRGMHRDALVDVLPHGERRLDLQGEARRDPERTEVHAERVHHVGVHVAGDLDDVTGRHHQLHGRHRGCEAAVAHAGPVGAGGAGTCHGDVWQRREVGQRPPLFVEMRRQLSVLDPAVDRHRVGHAVDVDEPVEVRQGDLIAGGVGDGVERMPAADRTHLGARRDCGLDVLDRGGLVEPLGPVLHIARPVALGHGSPSVSPAELTSGDMFNLVDYIDLVMYLDRQSS